MAINIIVGIIFLVFSTLGFCVCIEEETNCGKSIFRIVYGSLKGLGMTIVFALGAFLLAFILNFISMCVFASSYEEHYSYTQDIVAIKDNLGTDSRSSGSVFYSTGYIDSKLFYFYLVKEEDGLKQYQIEADDVFIQETENQPKIEIFNIKSNIPKHISVLNFGDTLDYAIIYVPKGTIIEDYEIDLE